MVADGYGHGFVEMCGDWELLVSVGFLTDVSSGAASIGAEGAVVPGPRSLRGPLNSNYCCI